MAHAKHIGKKEPKQLILVIGAAVALTIVVVATVAAVVRHLRTPDRLSAQSLINTIVTYEDIPVAEDAAFVSNAATCLNEAGETVCYAVTGYGEGFNDRLSVRCFFTLDGKQLIGIQVTDNSETQGYGAEVADSPFTQRFEYATLPVYLYDGSVPEADMPEQDGTRVDALSGATVSSRAVVEAVNHAFAYLQKSIL